MFLMHAAFVLAAAEPMSGTVQIVQMICMVVTALITSIGIPIVTYFLREQQARDKIAASKVEDVAVKADQVATAQAEQGSRSEKKLDTIHYLVNSGVIVQLQAYADLAAKVVALTERIVELTTDPNDKRTAGEAVDVSAAALAKARQAVTVAQGESATPPAR